jgi:plastocyanin
MKILNILILTLIIGVLAYVLFAHEEPIAAPAPQATDEEMSDDDHGDAMMEEDHEGMDVVVETEISGVVESDTTTSVDTTNAKVFTLDSFSYGYSETEIRVKEGDTVTINLTNSGGYHDWVIDEFNAATAKIRQGETTSVTFVADKTGTFEFYCSIGNHRAEGMVGKLIVE